ncbi:MAG: S9 family peptidase [Gemmatimonadetes bacterium]|nr:S9 family peptidase [Gemmatimonadota bacterium]
MEFVNPGGYVRGFWIVAIALVGGPGLLIGQGRERLTLQEYLEFEDAQDPRASPDGKQIVYTRRFIDKVNDRWDSALWIVAADGTRNRFLVEGGNARWSPDGTRIAFVAEGQPSGAQIFVRWMDAEGATSQITRVSQGPGDLEWSPDGKSIAFRMMVPMKEEWRVEVPKPPSGAKWTEAPYVVEKLNYRRDREGFSDQGFRHLFVVSADGGTPRQLTQGAYDHGAPKWTPDGRALVFSGNRSENADWEVRESEIYRVDVDGATVTQLTRRRGPDGQPAISPDGRTIAYTGFDATDDTWTDSKLYLMNADGSNVRVLTPTFDRSPQGLHWAADQSGVYFAAENHGSRNLYFVPVSGEPVRQVTRGEHLLGITSIDRAGNAVGVLTAWQKPNDVVTFNVARPQQITQLTAVNEDLLARKELASIEEIWYPSVDGFRIQGWIAKPPGFDRSKKYPLMLAIHGGPHSMYGVGFNFGWQEHAANGYVTLFTNPRGSTGYGSAFGNAIKFAYPSKDYDDLMAGVDTLVGRGYIDVKNMFVYGCSGGGVLTSWIVGHTDRFAAASANCPVTNWLSFVGTTDGAFWYSNFAKLPWEDPSEHLRRSPLMYVGNVKTPTMLMTGVKDLRTPIPQTEEFYMALKLRKVPTAMVRFNEEWHGTSSKPSNFLRTQAYLRHWFNRFANKPAATMD